MSAKEETTVNIAPTIAIEIDREAQTLHAVVNDGGEPRTISIDRDANDGRFRIDDSACDTGPLYTRTFAAACRGAMEDLIDDLIES